MEGKFGGEKRRGGEGNKKRPKSRSPSTSPTKPSVKKTDRKKIMEDPDGFFEGLPDETVMLIMCKLDAATMATVARLSKRFKSLYTDDKFVKSCLEPMLTGKQRLRRALLKFDIKFSSDDDDVHMAEATGKTLEGIEYDISLSCDEHHLADGMEETYDGPELSDVDSDDDNDDESGSEKSQPDLPPPAGTDRVARKKWFREKYDGRTVFVHGDISFRIPVTIVSYDVIKKVTTGITEHVMREFDDYLDSKDALQTNGYGGDDSYYAEFRAAYALPSGKLCDILMHARSGYEQYDTSSLVTAIREEFKNHIAHFDDVREKVIAELAKQEKELAKKSDEVQAIGREGSKSKTVVNSSIKFFVRGLKELVASAERYLKTISNRDKRAHCTRQVETAKSMIETADEKGPESLDLEEVKNLYSRLQECLEL